MQVQGSSCLVVVENGLDWKNVMQCCCDVGLFAGDNWYAMLGYLMLLCWQWYLQKPKYPDPDRVTH